MLKKFPALSKALVSSLTILTLLTSTGGAQFVFAQEVPQASEPAESSTPSESEDTVDEAPAPEPEEESEQAEEVSLPEEVVLEETPAEEEPEITEVTETPDETVAEETPVAEEETPIDEVVSEEETPSTGSSSSSSDDEDTFIEEAVDVLADVVEDFKNIITEKESTELTLGDNNIATIETVKAGVTYVAPQNDQVTVVFTKLPENPGSLSIEEVILTDEQVKMLGAVSNIAYDITSSMDNGSFSYDLELPSEGKEKNTKVVYAEDVDDLDAAIELSNDQVNIKSDKVQVEALDHFTIFVVTRTHQDFAGLTWIGDRTFPTGGIISETNDELIFAIDASEQASGDFYKTEGLQAEIPSGKNSVKVKLYVDPAWESVDFVRAGLWGIVDNASDEPSWPIMEYTNLDTDPRVRVWNTIVGGFTDIPGTVAYGDTLEFEVLENPFTDTFEFYLDDVLVHSYSSVDGSDIYEFYKGLILNAYNNGGEDYEVKWTDLELGVVEEVTDFNVTLTQIMCDDESYLPNMSGGADITATTATDFVAANSDHCWFAEGRYFDYRYTTSAFTVSDPTDANGNVHLTFTKVDNESTVGVRQIVETGDFPFTGSSHDNNVSAELYCHNDVGFYDNVDYVWEAEEGGDYYCVGWQVGEAPMTPTEMCLQETAGANLVVDGGFESENVTNGSGWQLFEGSELVAWLVNWISTPGNGDGPAVLEIQNNVNGWLAAEGTQYAELGTDWTTGDHGPAAVRIRQTFDTIPGATYNVFYQVAARPGTDADENVIQNRVRQANNDLALSNTHELGATSDLAWQPFTYSFVATGTESTIIFRDLGTQNTFGPFVDDVQVSCGDVGPSTPEGTDPDPVDPDPVDPTGIITYPVTDYDVESGVITLTAEYDDGDTDNDDAVQWAVRFGTCSASTNTVLGNVDGHSDVATWDGADFSFEFDTDTLADGNYCFVFNPTDDGPVDVRETRWFTIDNDDDSTGPTNTAPSIEVEPIVTITEGDSFDANAYVLSIGDAEDVEGDLVVTFDLGIFDANTPGTYTITYTVTDTGGLTGTDTLEVTVETASTPSNNDGNTGNNVRSVSFSTSGGQVLGAETEFGGCPAFTEYMKKGDFDGDGDTTEVATLQQFLNNELGLTLTTDGRYGSATEQAVHQFQQKYFDFIIAPWKLSGRTTGWFYKTSRIKANELLGCHDEAFLEDPAVNYSNGINNA